MNQQHSGEGGGGEEEGWKKVNRERGHVSAAPAGSLFSVWRGNEYHLRPWRFPSGRTPTIKTEREREKEKEKEEEEEEEERG